MKNFILSLLLSPILLLSSCNKMITKHDNGPWHRKKTNT